MLFGAALIATAAPAAADSQSWSTARVLTRPAPIQPGRGPAEQSCPDCAQDASETVRRRSLHWHAHWSRVGLVEYVAAPVLGAAALGITVLSRPARDPNWSRPVLFDRAAREQLRAESRSGRDTAKTVSDGLYVASVAHPVLVDNLMVTWVAHQASDVAWQMLWINAQAYALTLSLNVATKRLSLRERPWGDQCPDPSGEFPCDDGFRYRSFYSGHAALTATSAGLVCAHHTQLELYQSPVLDAAACASAVAITAATGALRIASDNHWASDVLTGHLTGYLSGYLLPTLLYYHDFRLTPERPNAHSPAAAIIPLATASSVQLAVLGYF